METTIQHELKTLRRILVPVDFSDHSENACLYAINLACKAQAEIKLLHVYYAPIVDLVPITDAYSIPVDLDLSLRQFQNFAKRNLLSFVARIREKAKENGFGHIKIGYSLREGIAGNQIAQEARVYKPGIIVLGTPGAGEKNNVMAHRMVFRLYDQTNVPVLVVPRNATYADSSGVKNVVYATEFDESDYVAIRRLMSILAGFHVRIYCINLARNAPKSWDTGKIDALINYFKKVNESIQLECLRFEGDNLTGQLLGFAKSLKIELIALTNRKRNLVARMVNPGIASKLLQESPVPMLVFKA